MVEVSDEGMTVVGMRGREWQWEWEQGEGEGKEARTTNVAGRRQCRPMPLASLLHPLREGHFSFIFFVTTHFVNRQ